MSASIDLVIFDCDGVLVNSEEVANTVFAEVLLEVCGLEFTLEDMFDTFVGHSRAQCLEKIGAILGEAPPPELDQRYQRDIDAALAESVEAIEGIESVLRQLQLPYCVASSGSHEKMKMTLGKTGLFELFDGNIFSTSEVERGKPHPDIYLHAAASMGFDDPARCLVVEDSERGLVSAVAAGMRCIVVPNPLAVGAQLDAAHHIVRSVSEIPAIVAGLLRES